MKKFILDQLPGLITGAILTWLGVVLAKEACDPVFVVDSIRSELISKEDIEDQPIKIFKAGDSTEIKQDLVSVTFYFFNRGNKSLTRELIMNPLKVVLLDTACELVSFKILKSSRRDIGISLRKDTTATMPSLDLDFTFLETNDGFTGQMTYLGNSDAQLALHGTILGKKDLNYYEFSNWQQARLQRLNGLLLLLVLVTVIVDTYSLVDYMKNFRDKKNKIYHIDKEIKADLEEMKSIFSKKSVTTTELEGVSQTFLRKLERKNAIQKRFNPLFLMAFLTLATIGIVYTLWTRNGKDHTKDERELIISSVPPNIKP